MNALLINLNRFGDLLQSQAAITGLHEKGARVALVCLDVFAEAAALMDNLERVIPLPEKQLTALLNGSSSREGGWREALALLGLLRREVLTVFRPDAVWNLTPTLPARILSLLLNQGEAAGGFGLDSEGFGVDGNRWASFLQASSQERGASPFNMTDVVRRIVGNGGTPDVPGNPRVKRVSLAAKEAVEKRLAKESPEFCNGAVALQLGASEKRRRWPLAYFAALGDALHEAGYCPVLIGGKDEKELAEGYMRRASRPAVDLCGDTSLAELAAVLCATRLLVTNDTGTMHLAAALDVPVLAVFLSTAQPFDTGPYQASSCLVEPDLFCHPCAFGKPCREEYACRKAIRPELLARLALAYLGAGRFDAPGPFPAGCGARVWLSGFDAHGLIDLRSISGHEKAARTVWFRIQRHYIRSFLDRAADAPFLPEAMDAAVPFDRREAEGLLSAAGAVLDRIELMRQQGNVLLVNPTPAFREKFLESWDKVRDVLYGCSHFRALSFLWTRETQGGEQDLRATLQTIDDFACLLERLAAHVREGILPLRLYM